MKNIAKTGGRCATCRRKDGKTKRLAALKEKTRQCRFPGCNNSYSSTSSRNSYCSPTHRVICDACTVTFTTKSTKPHAKSCPTCNEKKRVEKIKETNLERYGVSNVLEVPEIKAKAQQTILDKFGAEHAMKSSEVLKRLEDSMLEKYGVKNPLQDDAIKNRVRKTVLEKYGVDWASKAEIVKEKTQATNQERYNADWVVQTEEFKAKSLKTSLEKYGTPHPVQAPSVQAKIKATNLKKYGSECSLSNSEVREKGRDTRQRTRGVDYPTQDPLVREKIIATCLEKYGCENVAQHPPFKEKAQKTFQERVNSGLHKNSYKKISKHNLAKIELIKNAFSLSDDDIILEYALDGMQFDCKVGDVLLDFHPTISHNQERAFACILKNCSQPCEEHPPLPANYHYKRAQAAQRNQLSLVQIYDWDKDEALLRLLAGKFEKGWQKHSARKLHERSITQREANRFLALEHVQGGVSGQKFCYGLFSKENELLAVATFGKARFKNKAEYEFIRYAVKRGHIIHGGVQKLWRLFLADAKPASVVSYIDYNHTTAPTTFLHSLGFEEQSPTGPAKVWSKNDAKISHLSLLAQGADRLLSTTYGSRKDSGLNNEDIMLLEGWLPVETAGNRVFTWENRAAPVL